MKKSMFWWHRKRSYKISASFIDGIAHYGIEVIYGDEQRLIEDLSTRRAEVKMLCHQLWRGKVSPVTLQDVVEDWLER